MIYNHQNDDVCEFDSGEQIKKNAVYVGLGRISNKYRHHVE